MDEYVGGSRIGEWAESALCRQIDPEMFYPELPTPTLTDVAKRVCRECPVQPQCLDHAMTNHEEYGIWGGTTPTERQRIKRKAALKERMDAQPWRR